MLLLVPLALLFEKIDTLGTQNGRDGHAMQARLEGRVVRAMPDRLLG